jgi:hypothetical protein
MDQTLQTIPTIAKIKGIKGLIFSEGTAFFKT